MVERVLGKDEVMGSSPISSFGAMGPTGLHQVGRLGGCWFSGRLPGLAEGVLVVATDCMNWFSAGEREYVGANGS